MMKPKNSAINGASFRDPNGFVFTDKGIIHRQINLLYAKNYTHLMKSGLYDKLTRAGQLIPHTETEFPPPKPETFYKVIQPKQIPFISYPYEWPFGFLKSAALTTLSIQKKAIKLGMSLKDASAYNIQMASSGNPILIDTLSFDVHEEGEPWVAYRQFCQHFLAPLALMAYRDVRLGQLLKVYIDGIPLDLAAQLLPLRTRLNAGLLIHIHLHADVQQRYADKAPSRSQVRTKMSKEALVGLIESLEKTVNKLTWTPAGTEWGDYYKDTNYTDIAFAQKKEILSAWIARIKPKTVWDMGANDGSFSRLASEKGIDTLAFDIDPAAVEKNYQKICEHRETNLTPLILDLTNPSPAIGWHNRERETIFERGSADMVLALALIHHLAIANNVPFNMLTSFFADICGWLAIEFVPKSDSQVQRLLRSRKDIFPDYTMSSFEQAFTEKFDLIDKTQIQESERFLYLLKRKN